MADLREVFTTIESGTGEGQPLLSRQDGVTSAATGNHVGVLAFKDNSGDDVKPQLNLDGTVPVSFASGTSNSASGEVTVAALNTEEDVIAITLANNDVVNASMAMGGSFQPALFILYSDDDGTLAEIARFITGPGDFQHTANLDNIGFTAGATGTQRLVLRVTQLRGPLSDAHGTISCSVS